MKDIFVGNLEYETSEDERRQLFAAYGPFWVVKILATTLGETGKARPVAPDIWGDSGLPFCSKMILSCESADNLTYTIQAHS